MSQSEKTETSPKPKRSYRKGNPLTVLERKHRSISYKRESHKKLSIYIKNAYKDALIKLCEERGMTQVDMIQYLIEKEASLDADPENGSSPSCLFRD